MNMSTLVDDVVARQSADHRAASENCGVRQRSPALVSLTVAILLIMNGFIVGGLLVLEVGFMSSCSKIVLRFFWSLIWTLALAVYFYYWLIFVAASR